MTDHAPPTTYNSQLVELTREFERLAELFKLPEVDGAAGVDTVCPPMGKIDYRDNLLKRQAVLNSRRLVERAGQVMVALQRAGLVDVDGLAEFVAARDLGEYGGLFDDTRNLFALLVGGPCIELFDGDDVATYNKPRPGWPIEYCPTPTPKMSVRLLGEDVVRRLDRDQLLRYAEFCRSLLAPRLEVVSDLSLSERFYVEQLPGRPAPGELPSVVSREPSPSPTPIMDDRPAETVSIAEPAIEADVADAPQAAAHDRTVDDLGHQTPQAVTPQPGLNAGARPTIHITFGNNCWLVCKSQNESISLTEEESAVFTLFVRNIIRGCAGELVLWQPLNGALQDNTPDKQSSNLAKLLSSLNLRLRAWFALPDGGDWIVTKKGSKGGRGLNPAINWTVDESNSTINDLTRSSTSVSTRRTIDPRTLAGSTPSRGQNLPASPNRDHRSQPEEE